ncbi:MAG: protein kinase [Caldilineaceae bacterium]
MMQTNIFRGKDHYQVASDWFKLAGYDACMVRAEGSGQWFTLITMKNQSGDAEKARILRRASHILGTVESIYVIKAYDIGWHENELFLILEKLEGLPLVDWLSRQKTISEFTALNFLRQLGLLLKDLQYFRVSHGNLRIESLLVSPDSSAQGRELVRVWDLVLASTQDVTTPYTSPEVMDEKPFDIRADIYSIAAIIYRLLAGVPPFQGSAGKLYNQITGPNQPSPLAEVRPDLSQACVRLIERGMMKRAVDRFDSASELVMEVQRVLGGRSDASEHLFHLAQTAANREEWEEVLRLAKKADSLPGARARLIMLEREASRRLEEDAVASVMRELDQIDALIRSQTWKEAMEQVVATRKQMHDSRHLQRARHKVELGERLEHLEALVSQRLRFQPAFLQSLDSARQYPLQATSVGIGRAAAPASRVDVISLSEEPNAGFVSRDEHVRFLFAEGHWRVRKEAATTNPTLVEAQELKVQEEQLLQDGTIITVGKIQLRFSLVHEAEEVA